MPPKEMPEMMYSIQIDENRPAVTFKHIDEITNIGGTGEEKEIKPYTFDDMYAQCFESEIKMKNRDWNTLLISICLLPSNNWLKMHGYPMRRRVKHGRRIQCKF